MSLTHEYKLVANYIIKEINKFNEGKNFREQVIMSTRRLQRLLYFCDIEYMKRNNGVPLFLDDFYAWPSGPVIPDAYSRFMQFPDGKLPTYGSSIVELTDDIKAIIHEVLVATKDLDTLDLANISNVSSGPWHQVYREDDKDHKQIISKEEIYNFYLNRQLFENIAKEETENLQEKEFTIRRHNNAIIIEKNSQSFTIDQGIDDDIFFSTSRDELTLELNFSSRNYSEWQTYIVFEYLMKCIVGKYMLNGENAKKYSRLPNDFIDLKNKIITWHSDSGRDNVLKFEYIDNRIIRISISKCKDSKNYHNNSVRIRTNGSDYGCCYQEFLEFFKHLLELEQRLNNSIKNIHQQEKNKEPKKLSLFRSYK